MYVSLWRGKIPHMRSFWAARYQLLYEGARAKLQLISEVAQIIPSSYFLGLVYILNVADRVFIAVQQTPNSPRYLYGFSCTWVVT